MSDPAYAEGVNPISVIRTMDSIASAIKGETNHIDTPQPLNLLAPVLYITLKDGIGKASYDSNRVRTQNTGNSRRSMSYNLHHGIDPVGQTARNSYALNSHQDDMINVNIDDLMKSYKSHEIDTDDIESVHENEYDGPKQLSGKVSMPNVTGQSTGRSRRRVGTSTAQV